MTCDKPIYVAITIDDGPRRGPTEDFIRFLNDEGIKATFYVVRSNIEQYGEDNYYKLAQTLLKQGHEIAIHEALPRAEANRTILFAPSRGGGDRTEHVPPFPSRRFWSYRNNDYWGAHLESFKAELKSNVGADAKFLRVPGGLFTELMDYRSFMGSNYRVNSLIAWMNRTYRFDREYTQDEKLASLQRVVGSRNLRRIYLKMNDFMKWMDVNDLKLWGGRSIMGSTSRTTSFERQITTQYIDPQSWTAEIGTRTNNAEYVISRRFRRFQAGGRVNNAIAPYVVVLTHDNPGYISTFRRTIRRIKNLHQVRDGEICLEFVTMSELYKTVSDDPANQ